MKALIMRLRAAWRRLHLAPYQCGYEYAKDRLIADDCAAGKLWMAHKVSGWTYEEHRDFDKGVQDAVKDYIAKLEENYQAARALDV